MYGNRFGAFLEAVNSKDLSRLPSLNNPTDDFVEWLHRIHLQIVSAKGVCLEVVEAFARRAIGTLAFSTLDFVCRSVNPDPKDIKGGKQLVQFVCPALALNDVLYEKIISRSGKGVDRLVESPENFALPASRASG